MLLSVDVILTRLHVIRIHYQTFLELVHCLLPILHVYRNGTLRKMIVIFILCPHNRLCHPVKILHRKSILRHILKRITSVAMERICCIIQQRVRIDRIFRQGLFIMRHRLIIVSLGDSTIALSVLSTIHLSRCICKRQQHQHRSHHYV